MANRKKNLPYIQSDALATGAEYLLNKIYGIRAVGGIRWLFYFILQSAALSVRVFFRRRIGDRSFGPEHIFASYIWVRCFLFNQWTFNPPGDLNPLNELIFYILQFLKHLYTVIVEAVTFSFGQGSQIIYWYSFIVLLLGIFHWLPILKHSMLSLWSFTHYRGESVFFSWLQDKEANLGFDRNPPITATFIRTVVDPLFIIALGVGIIAFLNETSFGYCIIISGIALLMEEYSIFKAIRNIELDRLDGEYVAQQIEKGLEKYKRIGEPDLGGRVPGRGAVLASPEDAQKMYNYIERNKGRTPKLPGAKIS